MAIWMEEARRPAIEPDLVGDHGERESGRLEDRLDVEAEPVRDQGDVDAAFFGPRHEGGEGRGQWAVLDGEGEHLLGRASKRGGLESRRLPDAHLTALDGFVVGA